MKHCTRCQTEKPRDQFYKSKANKDGLQTWCKSCTKQTQSESRKENPDKHSKWSKDSYYKNHAKSKKRVRHNTTKWAKENPELYALHKFRSKLKKYGLTEESYNALVSKQNNCCAICGTNPMAIGEELSIDHCHETGKVRGLLCRPCNLGIGNLKDSLELVLKAANYLRRSSE